MGIDDVPCSILNDDIDLNLVKKHFTDDAWLAVNDIFETKFELGWYCQSCRDCLTTGPSVGCDDCLNWFHQKCANLKTIPKTAVWFCTTCKK